MTEIQFVARLGLALLLGGLIGLERQWRQRTAGLRTNALVATGSALFVMVAVVSTADVASLPRIAAQVVSGIGFLGAGVIMREGVSVRGLNTAIHLLMRPLAVRINRQPIDNSDVEVQYRVLLTCRGQDEAHIRALLLQSVAGITLLLRGLHSEDQYNPSKVEVRADLVSAGRNDLLLEQLVSRLSLEPGVSAVSWETIGQELPAAG